MERRRKTLRLMAAAKRPGTSIDKSGQFIFQRQRVSTLKKKIRKAKIYTRIHPLLSVSLAPSEEIARPFASVD